MKRFLTLSSCALVLAVSTAAFAGDHACTAGAQECLDKMATSYASYGWAGLEGEYNEEKGIFVVDSVDGPAVAAGIEVNDVLFGINGQKFADMDEESWTAIKADRTPGKTVTYMVKHAGTKHDVDIVLAEMPKELLAKKIGAHMLEHAQVASLQ